MVKVNTKWRMMRKNISLSGVRTRAYSYPCCSAYLQYIITLVSVSSWVETKAGISVFVQAGMRDPQIWLLLFLIAVVQKSHRCSKPSGSIVQVAACFRRW